MLSISKGKVGELAIRKDLILCNYNVYLPEVDNGIDLLVELSIGLIKKVQIKSVYKLQTDTSLVVDTRKYINTNRVDVVAIYYEPKDDIAYVPFENQGTINLALQTAKNYQDKKRKWFYGYRRFPEFS